MPDVAIISANYGAYDAIKSPLPQAGLDAEWVLVTDSLEFYLEWEAVAGNPTLAYGNMDLWRVIYEPSNESGMRAAKHPKTQPWKYTDAPASIWIDGSVIVKSESFASEALALADPIAQFDHEWRNCLYTEAAFSLMHKKYSDEPIAKQIAQYHKRGHPWYWGLWATTVIARRHTDTVVSMGEAWQHEIDTWSFQDQVSQPFVLRNNDLRPSVFPDSVASNPWLNHILSENHRLG